MDTATTRLLDAIRAANGNCSDYRAGKLLGVGTSAVSKWRVGKGHMSISNVSKACELAGIPDQTWEWQIRIGAEREKGPDGDLYRETLRDLDSYRTTGQPSPNGLISMILRSAHAAAILAAVLLVSAFVPSGETQARAIADVRSEVVYPEPYVKYDIYGDWIALTAYELGSLSPPKPAEPFPDSRPVTLIAPRVGVRFVTNSDC